MALYKEALNYLIEKDRVYKCYCTPDELSQRREEARKQGCPPGYDGRCRKLDENKIKEYKNSGRNYVYRIKTPDKGAVSFKDIVKGKIEIDTGILSDFVLFKSDGMPTYNFACVVDDSDLNITHIIRGDDHISNTHNQILLYRALDKEIPEFAHLPQVHGTDGKRLSKRTGAVSLDEYREKGYLPEALRNYLVLLGWSTKDSQQIFKWEELKNKFKLTRCGKSAGVFDLEKLNWMNGKYIRSLSSAEIAQRAAGWLKKEGLIEDKSRIPDKVIEAIEVEKDKIKLLSEIPELVDYMIKDNIIYQEKAVKKRLKKEGVRDILKQVIDIIENIGDFNEENLEKAIRAMCEETHLGAGKIFHPVRVAVSGRMKGPGVFELLRVIGKQKTIERLQYALDKYVD
jgi:glutamyl-tRNA synthetase